MDKELDRYELLAHPNPPNPVKAKAPPIGSTLTDLAVQLRQLREMVRNGGCTTSQSVQEMMKHAASVAEKSKGLVDDRLKETHASSVKIAKLIDKRTPGMLPELGPDMFQSEEAAAALRRTVAQHLVRSGSLETAEIFARESGESVAADLTGTFNQLRYITDRLRQGDIDPALQWTNENRAFLTERRSPLEFHLHRSRYLKLLQKTPFASQTDPAFQYLAEHLLPLYTDYPAEIDRLGSCPLWVSMGRLSSSPYADLASAALHTGLEAEFTKEYASRMQIGREAPLKVLNHIGGGNALVRIEKGKKVMKERRGDWTNNDDLPVEIPLEPEYRFHSVFTCPVSKDQATEQNPPMMLQCGHVLVRESLTKLTKAQHRVKCPYCPMESYAKDVLEVHF